MDNKHLFERLENARTGEAVTEGVPEKHQLKIAKDTLRMHDAGARIMGGMSKEQARSFLKSQGWDDAKIKKLELGESTSRTGEITESTMVEYKGDVYTATCTTCGWDGEVKDTTGWGHIQNCPKCTKLTLRIKDTIKRGPKQESEDGRCARCDKKAEIKGLCKDCEQEERLYGSDPHESVTEMSDQIRRERIEALTKAIQQKKAAGDPWEAEKEELLQLRKEIQTESGKKLVARWSHKKGNAYVELYKDDLGYTYRADRAGGSLPAFANDEEATRYVQTKHIDTGLHAPDAYKTRLQRESIDEAILRDATRDEFLTVAKRQDVELKSGETSQDMPVYVRLVLRSGGELVGSKKKMASGREVFKVAADKLGESSDTEKRFLDRLQQIDQPEAMDAVDRNPDDKEARAKLAKVRAEIRDLKAKLGESSEDLNMDSKMFAKGYRYCLSPKSKKFEPLYVKTASDAGPLMRDYPDEKFDVRPISEKVEDDMDRYPEYEVETWGKNILTGKSGYLGKLISRLSPEHIKSQKEFAKQRGQQIKFTQTKPAKVLEGDLSERDEKPNRVKIKKIGNNFYGRVVNRYGDELRKEGNVHSVSMHSVQAAAKEKWPGLPVDKFYEACTHQGRTEKGQFDAADGTGQVMADSEDEPGFAFMKDKDRKDREKDALGERDENQRKVYLLIARLSKKTAEDRDKLLDMEDEKAYEKAEKALKADERKLAMLKMKYAGPRQFDSADEQLFKSLAHIKVQEKIDVQTEKGLSKGEYYAQKGSTPFGEKPSKDKERHQQGKATAGKSKKLDALLKRMKSESEENDDLDHDADGVTDGVVADGDEESQMEPIAPKIGEAENDWCRELIRQIGTGVRMNIGMRDMVKDDAKRKLQFRVGGGTIKKMVITLTGMDDYNIEGWKGRSAIDLKKVKEFKGIYADQLGEILIKLNSILHGHNESAETRQKNHLYEALDMNSRPETEE